MKKRGYFVHEADDEGGFAVVANSITHAKQLGAGELMCDWVNIRATWQRDSDVSDLPVGVIEDDMLALRRGLYGWCEQATCDICNEDKHVECIGLTFQQDGVIACGDCIDDGLSDYHIQVLEMEANNE